MANDLTGKELLALRYIRNCLVHGEASPSLRKIMAALGYQSPRSASLIVDSLIKKGYLGKFTEKRGFRLLQYPAGSTERVETMPIPLIGTAACGQPILAEECIEAMIPVSKKLLKSGNQYFMLRAKGDSMTETGINDGDYVLVKQQTQAENGEIVVALINDEATIKEFRIVNDLIYLLPRSNNKEHQPLIFTNDLVIQGVVTQVLPKI